MDVFRRELRFLVRFGRVLLFVDCVIELRAAGGYGW